MAIYNKNIIKIFYNFLIKRKIYDSYITNFYHANSYVCTEQGLINFLTSSVREDYAGSLIGAAFTWSRTKEGKEFWFTIDKAWKEYLIKYQNKM
jgi:uncharacterized membrane protein YbaN (DUF454 family)